MANTRARRTAPRSRRWPIVLVLLALVLAGLFWWYRADAFGYSRAGTAYAARVGCSCRFVAGRSLEDCEKDFLAGMEAVSLSEDEEAKSVTATFPLLASDTATLRDGYGCVLEEWED